MGADAVAGIIQGVADVGTLVNDIISGIYEMKATEKAQGEARKLAYIQRADLLKQNRAQNYMAQQGIDISRGQLSQQRKQFQEQMKFTRQQYIDQKKARVQDMARSDRASLMSNTMGMINQDQNLKNSILSRMAA